jgi:hypothetical protein
MNWIPVTERMPDLHKPVLMWGPDGRVCSGWRSDGGNRPDGYWWPADEGGWYEDDEVTHWAELPEPPAINVESSHA